MEQVKIEGKGRIIDIKIIFHTTVMKAEDPRWIIHYIPARFSADQVSRGENDFVLRII